MKSTELTKSVANIILVLYILYAIFYVPFNATLISAAVGLVAYGGFESYEAAVALTLITGILFALMVKPSASVKKEGFSGGSPKEISERVSKMTGGLSISEPQGVFASQFVEGFEDLSGAISSSPSSTSAPTTTLTQPIATAAASLPASPPSTATSNPSTASSGTTTEAAVSSFRSGGSESDSLFKLGVIPEEGKGGYHIDQGTTVINALNALKPDQLKQMTADTQKLIDTQKNLMGLLSNIKPMMADGKQMMDTFQQMFGNSPQGNPFA